MKHTRITLVLFTVIFIASSLSAQKVTTFKTAIEKYQNFDKIVAVGNEYFYAKHPDRTPAELSSGQYRDGEYVKFQRWQRFWRDRLNPDGSLADLSRPAKEAARRQQKSSLGPFASVRWSEINYTNYITGQIGVGRTTSLAFHPTNANIFYVGAAIGGIWKTTDGGQSYVPLGDDLPFLAVSAIVVDQDDPETIYIAISDHVWYGPQGIGIYKSTDGGANWTATALSFDFSENVRIYAMVANPSDADEIYVATANGIYKTTDGFATVSQIQEGDCRDIRLRPGNPQTVYAGMSDGRILKSTNSGSFFSEVADLGFLPVLMAVSPADNQKLWVRHGNGLFRSDDAGSTFERAGTFSESNEVFTIAPGSTSVILSGNFHCYRSEDGGRNFSPTSEWLGREGLPLVHVDQRNMFVNPLESDAVYYCNDGGLYRYNITANSFDNLSNGLAITQYYDIAVAQTNSVIVGGGSQDNGNVYRQADGSWLQYATTGDGMNQEIDPSDAGIRYWSYQNGGINRWQNGTNTSIRPSEAEGGAWETPYKIDPSNPSRIIAGYRKVWESFDKGNSWRAISNNLSGSNMNELAIAPTNGERIYVTSGNRIYVKSITDSTWTSHNLPAGEISDLEVDPIDINKVYVSVSGYSAGNKIFVSTDAGASWTNISGGLPNTSVGALELYHSVPGAIFIGTDLGVFYRDDTQPDWQAYGDLPNTRVEDIEIQYAAKLIRVGTHGRGVLEASIIVDDPAGAIDPICEYRVNNASWIQNDCNPAVRAGDRLELAVDPNGLTYQWSGPGGFSGMGGNGGEILISDNITAAQAGTYSVTLTDSQGASAVQSLVVTVNANPLPELDQFIRIDGGGYSSGNRVTVCEGQTVTLDFGGAFGAGWTFAFTRPDGQWTGFNYGETNQGVGRDQLRLAFPNLSNGGADEGVWTVEYTDPNGRSNTATFAVNVNTIPEVTTSKTDGVCGEDGSITFTFPDNPERGAIEFSIDGGASYPFRVNDNVGSFTTTQPAGTYNLFARWGNYDCPINLPNRTINAAQASSGGAVAPVNQTICAGVRSVPTLHTLSGQVGEVVRWEYKPPGGNWTNWGGAGSTTAPWNCCFETPGQWQVRAITQAGNCAAVPSAPANINVQTVPTITSITTTDESCGQDNGSITLVFEDDPGRTGLEFSIDGGASYPFATPDNVGSFTIPNLASGTYNLFARWGNYDCPINLPNRTINADPAPQITDITKTDETCSESNGTITFNFPDTDGRTWLEFSIDGGASYPFATPDNVGSFTIPNLASGTYNLFARWGNYDCPINLPNRTINAQDVITNVGTITGNEAGCEGYNPAPITGTAATTSGPAVNVTYQWERSVANGPWVEINGATELNFDPTGPTVEETRFRRRAFNNNGCGNDVSNIVTKRVNSLPDLTQFIRTDGGSYRSGNMVTVCEGQTVTLDFGGAFGAGWTFAFTRPDGQWTGFNYGATNQGIGRDQLRLAFPNLSEGGPDEGIWTVVYTNPNGCSNTTTFTVSVDARPQVTTSSTNEACGVNGSITFTFPDTDGRTWLEFSIDGGASYPFATPDNVGSFTIPNLASGTYDLFVRWGNDDCPVNLPNRTIDADPAPQITDITKTDETCSESNGTITFTFPDTDGRTGLEFSIDGGASYPFATPDNVGSFTIPNLASGTYDLFVRWGNDDCPVNLPNRTIDAVQASGGGAVVPVNQTICAGVRSVPTLHTLSGQVGEVVRWEYKPPGGNWTNWRGAGSTTAPRSCCFGTPGQWQVRAITQAGNCAAVSSAPANINVQTVPTITSITTTDESCGQDNGSITLVFEDDPGRTGLEFSIDGGASYPFATPDNVGSFTIPDLAPGTYDLFVRWGNDDCPVNLPNRTIDADPAPQITDITKTDETCSESNGTITFTFPDTDGRTGLEFSIDGGASYPFATPDNVGSFTIPDLAPGTYDLFVRWGNYDCPVNLPNRTIDAVQASGGGAVVPVDQTICAGVRSVPTLHTLSGQVGEVVRWEYKSPGGNWTNWGGAGSTTAPWSCCFGTPGQWQVRAITQVGNCTAVPSAPANINVQTIPTITSITKTDESCGQDNGSITLVFEDDPGRTGLEFSIDGGASYPFATPDNVGSFTIPNLASGIYDLFVRWGNDDCPVNLPNRTINNAVQASGGGAVVPVNQTICAGVRSVPELHTLSGQAGEVVRWEYKPPGGNWTNWRGAGSTTAPWSCCFGTPGQWQVRAITQVGSCTAVPSAPANINVQTIPTITSITKTDESCGQDNGSITLIFEDDPGRTGLEFSIDGGASYPFATPDNVGSFTIPNLASGAYDLLARWGNDDCPIVPGGQASIEIVSLPCNASPSLSWESFAASAIDHSAAQIYWRTSGEDGIAHYRIERSYEGQSFDAVATIPAQNNKRKQYDFTDTSVSGTSAYYRITGVGFDGAETISTVAQVVWSNDDTDVRLFPNPVKGQALTVSWYAQPARQYQCYIYNSYGQLIRQQSTVTEAEGTRTMNISTLELPTGVYFLRMQSHDWDWTGNFVVQ